MTRLSPLFRLGTTVALAFSATACAWIQQAQAPERPLAQEGTLKVHPGLLGQPVPPELMPADARRVATVQADAQSKEKEGMKVDIAGLRTQRSLYFDYDSSSVKAEFDPMLQAHARYLASNAKSRVRIEGNADERGSAEYNGRLGMKRAEAVRQALIGHGAGSQQVVIKTLGELRPRLKGHDEESWAENRRADIVYEREE